MTLSIVLLLAITAIFSVPHLLGMNVYAVASGSMEPAYPVGSLVFSRQVEPGEVEEGDCITYLYGDNTITHRVVTVDLENERFITKGDANQEEDTPVAFGRLVGKTSPFFLPFLGYLVISLKSIHFDYWTVLLIAGAVILLAANILLLNKIRKCGRNHEAKY